MSQNKSRGKAKIGFTLIELLIVIAIVSVLAAILFPVLAQVKQVAKKTVCASNLRQLAFAYQLYSNDSDDISCPAYRYDADWTNEEAWDFSDNGKPGLLAPYTKTGEINQCPEFKGQSWGRPFTGYAYNTGYIGGDWANNIPPAQLSQIGTPSETALFSDAAYSNPALGCNYLRAPSDSLFLAGTVHFRHNGLANVVFADTHLKAIASKFNQPDWAPETGSISKGDERYDLD